MPLIIFHGDNRLEIGEALHEIRERFESADVLSFDGAGLSLPALSEACLTAGLFAPERLVIVEDLQERYRGTKKEAPEVEEVVRILDSIPSTTTVVLVSSGVTPEHQLLKDVRKVGGEVRFKPIPKKYELPRWVQQRGQKLGIKVGTEAAQLLVELAGADPSGLENELAKLATYAGEEKEISLLMVETLVGAVTQDSIFSLVDAIAGRDEGKALQLLRAQLERSSSGPMEVALSLIRLLARQIRILLGIRLGQEEGRSVSQITNDLKLPRYYADRYFRQAKNVSKQALIESFEKLASLEQNLKTGKAEPAVGLDLLIADMCS